MRIVKLQEYHLPNNTRVEISAEFLNGTIFFFAREYQLQKGARYLGESKKIPIDVNTLTASVICQIVELSLSSKRVLTKDLAELADKLKEKYLNL